MERIVAYIRRHHVGLLALGVALGGTSYAAVKLPEGSVGAKQIKRNAITSAKVRDGSLLASDFKKGQLPAAADGEPGPAGPIGERGTQGLPGAAGATVLARPHGETSMTAAAAPASYPLAGNSWTQQARQSNLVLGEMTVERPTGLQCAGGTLTATLAAGAKTVAITSTPPASGTADTTVVPLPAATAPSPTASPAGLFEPGVDTSRTLTLTLADNCVTALHFKVTGVRIVVYGLS